MDGTNQLRGHFPSRIIAVQASAADRRWRASHLVGQRFEAGAVVRHAGGGAHASRLDGGEGARVTLRPVLTHYRRQVGQLVRPLLGQRVSHQLHQVVAVVAHLAADGDRLGCRGRRDRLTTEAIEQ